MSYYNYGDDILIIVIATIECTKDSINYVKNELCKLVPYTLREPGCVTYNFYQDNKDLNFFHSYEIWINQDSIDKHLKTNHLQNYFKNTKPFITNFNIREMNKIC